MRYFAAYWQQVTAFYRTVWALTFRRSRNLDGPLSEYVMKPGFFWQFMEMHQWLAVTIFKIPIQVFMLVVSYAAMALILLLLVLTPLIILVVFPIFMFKNYRDIRSRGELL